MKKKNPPEPKLIRVTVKYDPPKTTPDVVRVRVIKA